MDTRKYSSVFLKLRPSGFYASTSRRRDAAIAAGGTPCAGALEAVLACCEIPFELVEPSVWKRAHPLRGGDKEGARQLALQLFPAAHLLLARKRDHQRAEAALVALTTGRRN